MIRVRSLLIAGALLPLLLACGSDDEAAPPTIAPAPDVTDEVLVSALPGETELLVGAASSLTDAFTTIGTQFEEANPGTAVEFTFDSSSALATQIAEGAPVDVFVSADEASMITLDEEGIVEIGPIVARNELVIVVPAGNPDGVEGLADLAALDVVALCAEDAPCGRFAAQSLDTAGVTLAEDRITRSPNARATLGAVTDGDADAAIVYVSDALAGAPTVEAVTIPPVENVQAVYPTGMVVETEAADLADAFIAYLLGPDAQAVLEEQGFLAP
jgi:molybdate transport system substrate-binding protein